MGTSVWFVHNYHIVKANPPGYIFNATAALTPYSRDSTVPLPAKQRVW
jgi:hypothetical protein